MESDDRALWDCLVALRERWITPNQFMEIIHGIDALCSFFALMPFPDTAEVGEVGIYGVATPAPVAQKQYHNVAQRLYSLLDDIDTASDLAKDDDKLYRAIVQRTQAKKSELVVEYAVVLVDDSMLAAVQAKEGKP